MIPQFIDWTVPPDPQEIERLRETARLSWPEKLQWLEEMQRLVEFINPQPTQLQLNLQIPDQTT
ncbi:hypothetical protein IAD21_03051 [Abditibacteriota bacterium]|nr:hypothetical protein IAD21_03051 [Abditibacteriota bacterium]